MLRNKKKTVKKISNQRANKKYFSHVPVSAMSSFNLIKEFKLVRKKYEKIKNGFNVCFQNKANVPITIINCGVCLLPCGIMLLLQRAGIYLGARLKIKGAL